jgi:hypothetical protein
MTRSLPAPAHDASLPQPAFGLPNPAGLPAKNPLPSQPDFSMNVEALPAGPWSERLDEGHAGPRAGQLSVDTSPLPLEPPSGLPAGFTLDGAASMASPHSSISSDSPTLAGRRLSSLMAALPPETRVPKTFFDYSKGPSPVSHTLPLPPAARPPPASAKAEPAPGQKLARSTSKHTDRLHRCEECKASFNRYHDLKRHQVRFARGDGAPLSHARHSS